MKPARNTVVNLRTGVLETQSAYVENLRAIEMEIQRLDADILERHADLKTAREAREKAVSQLRSGIREGKVLPLLETEPEG